MTPLRRFVSSPCFAVLVSTAFGQNSPAASKAPAKIDKASSYYNYSLGHMYAELASAYANNGSYFTKAVESYRAALKADPGATFIAEELSDLYIQSGRLREAVLEAADALKQNPDALNSRRLLPRIYTRLIGDSQPNKVNENMFKNAIVQYPKIPKAAHKNLTTCL